MIKQFKEAVALQPDGIAIYGFPGDEAMRPIIKEAREMGIVITTMNTPLPDLEAEYKTEGFGYAGADLFDAGYNLGKKLLKFVDYKLEIKLLFGDLQVCLTEVKEPKVQLLVLKIWV